jgi:S-disulfanyl-L-cysteine oxidoreductase SoxD
VISRLSVLISFFLFVLGLAAASRSVAEGVYTKEQAARGMTDYKNLCARCHGENLLGGDEAPSVAGADFVERWTGKTVGDLFELIRTTMPSDGPGTLSRKQSADITAYLLSVNEYPAGKTELVTETAPLKEIRIEPKK